MKLSVVGKLFLLPCCLHDISSAPKQDDVVSAPMTDTDLILPYPACLPPSLSRLSLSSFFAASIIGLLSLR